MVAPPDILIPGTMFHYMAKGSLYMGLNLGSWDGEVILDYPGTSVLMKEREGDTLVSRVSEEEVKQWKWIWACWP